jgi:thiol-disulfide isomerase/thioredoxin
MPFPFVLLLVLAVLHAQNAPVPNAPARDGLALLTEVGKRYADAKSYHIEAVEESTTSNDLQRSWQKTLITAIVAPDGRYRYEGRSGYSAAIVVFDGTTQWIYHPYDHHYTQKTTPSKYPPDGTIPQEEMVAVQAKSEAAEVARRARRLKSATFLPDETISIDDRSFDCYVVHYSDADLKNPREDFKQDETIWIDKSRKLVLKTLSRTETHMHRPGSEGGPPLHQESTVVFTTVELNQQEPAPSFAFAPPSDAKLIAEFPNPFGKQFEYVDLTGKPAPDLKLKSSDGRTMTLSSLRGHPVFIEFWATWCEPCVELMPDLTRLYVELKGKELAWMSIDSDYDSSVAAKFISQKQIPWANYHDEDGSLGKAFHRIGIPLGVLIDGSGTVVFYQSGYEVSDLRAAIAKLGPQFSSVAPPNTSDSGSTSN